MAKLDLTKGGCWFCCEDEENEELIFCHEFDTYVHMGCLLRQCQEDPDDPEVKIMAIEFGMNK